MLSFLLWNLFNVSIYMLMGIRA